MTMDEVAYQEKFDFDKALFDAFAQVQIGGEKVIFMKPLTFMNLSGEAIVRWWIILKLESKTC